MTEQPTGAGQAVPPEGAVLPKPLIGEGSQEPGSAGDRGSVEAVIDAKLSEFESRLEGKLGQLVQGRIDSTKDRRFERLGDLGQRIDEINSYIESAKGDVREGLRNMAIDDLLAEGRLSGVDALAQRGQTGPGRSVSPAAAIPAISAETEVDRVTTRILNEAAIPFDDPEVVRLSNQSYPSVDHWELELHRMVDRRRKQAANPAAVVVEGARRPVDTNPDLRADYNKRLEQLKGSRNPRALIDLRKEFRNRGLDV